MTVTIVPINVLIDDEWLTREANVIKVHFEIGLNNFFIFVYNNYDIFKILKIYF